MHRYGPLVRQWTMRYEAKHNHLKKLAQNIGNFINIALTLATRHQYWQCYKWQEGDLMDDEPEVGPGIITFFIPCTRFIFVHLHHCLRHCVLSFQICR